MAGQTKARDPRVSYFVTVRTLDCRPVFHEDKSASTLVEVIEETRRRMGFKKYAYVVLPDHYHLLLGAGPASAAVADVILSINRTVEHFLAAPGDERPLWDPEPEVLVLYSAGARMEKLNYIHRKPVLCGVAKRAEDYAYSSAGFYFRRYGKAEF